MIYISIIAYCFCEYKAFRKNDIFCGKKFNIPGVCGAVRERCFQCGNGRAVLLCGGAFVIL